MPVSRTLFIESFADGQLIGELCLPSGKVTELTGGSGSGKTALGVYLREESHRRLDFFPGSRGGGVPRHFRSTYGWELRIRGPIGLVELADGSPSPQTAAAFFGLDRRIREILRLHGKSECPKCGGEIIASTPDHWAKKFSALEPEQFILLGFEATISPSDALELLPNLRRLRIRRVLVDGVLMQLPEPEEMQNLVPKITILMDSFGSRSEEQSERIQSARIRAEEIRSIFFNSSPPAAFIGNIKEGDPRRGREFVEVSRFDLSTPFCCNRCGTAYRELPAPIFQGHSDHDLFHRPLSEVVQILHGFDLSPLEEIFQIDPDLKLSEPLEILPVETRVVFQLLKLIELRLSDAVVYCDYPNSPSLDPLLEKLATADNVVVAGESASGKTGRDKISLRLLPPKAYRLMVAPDVVEKAPKIKAQTCSRLPGLSARGAKSTRILPFSAAGGVNLFYQLIGIEAQLASLFGSQPGARQRGLSETDFLLSHSRCPICTGRGYVTGEISRLGSSAETCPACLGERFTGESLQVRYLDHTISDLLRLSLGEAQKVLARRHEIGDRLRPFIESGLESYLLGDEVGMAPTRGRLLAELTGAAHKNVRAEYVIEAPLAFFGDVQPAVQVQLDAATKTGVKIYFLTARRNSK